MTANLILAPIPVRPCIKCGAAERNKKGDCKVCAEVTRKKHLAENSDKVRARRAAQYAANSDKEKAIRAARYAKNPDSAKARAAAWRIANPALRKIHYHNRRTREKTGGQLSRDLVARLFKLQKGKCPCCKQPLGDDSHLDHIMPLALDGSNTDDNMQLLRAKCNLQKNKKDPLQFMRQRGFLL